MLRITQNWQPSISLVELLGLSIWIGGLAVILTTVIPVVFSTFSMEQGGRFLRRVFDSYNNLTIVIIFTLLGTAIFRTWKFQKTPDRILSVTRWEWILLCVLIFVTGLIVFAFEPKTIELQAVAFAAITQEEKKTAYDEFFRIHMIVRALHLINVGAAISLLAVKFRECLKNRSVFSFE